MFLLEIEAETHPLAVRPASTALSGEGDWGWGQQANHLQRIVGPSPAWVWPPYSASLSPKFYEVSQCSYAAGPTIQPWTTPPISAKPTVFYAIIPHIESKKEQLNLPFTVRANFN